MEPIDEDNESSINELLVVEALAPDFEAYESKDFFNLIVNSKISLKYL